MKKRYHHIFFDLDNTLWDFEKNSGNAMRIAYSYFFPTVDFSFEQFFHIYSRINDQLWGEYKKRQILKKDLIHKRFKHTFAECHLSGVEPEEMNALYFEEMAKQKDLKPGTLKTLQYLKSKNYILHIITNGFKEVQNRKIETSGLKPFIKNIFISEDVKVPKPGYEIFEYAIKSSNAKKSASLMVGDDWTVDIAGANQFGIDSAYISSKNSSFDVCKKAINRRNEIYIFPGIEELTTIL